MMHKTFPAPIGQSVKLGWRPASLVPSPSPPPPPPPPSCTRGHRASHSVAAARPGSTTATTRGALRPCLYRMRGWSMDSINTPRLPTSPHGQCTLQTHCVPEDEALLGGAPHVHSMDNVDVPVRQSSISVAFEHRVCCAGRAARNLECFPSIRGGDLRSVSTADVYNTLMLGLLYQLPFHMFLACSSTGFAVPQRSIIGESIPACPKAAGAEKIINQGRPCAGR